MKHEGEGKLRGGLENIPNTKLSGGEKENILDYFRNYQLKADEEYFIITHPDGNETRIHAWDSIPIADENGNITDRIPIKKYLEERLMEIFGGEIEEDKKAA